MSRWISYWKWWYSISIHCYVSLLWGIMDFLLKQKIPPNPDPSKMAILRTYTPLSLEGPWILRDVYVWPAMTSSKAFIWWHLTSKAPIAALPAPPKEFNRRQADVVLYKTCFFLRWKGERWERVLCIPYEKPSVSLTKALLNPYFWEGGTLGGGGWLAIIQSLLQMVLARGCQKGA